MYNSDDGVICGEVTFIHYNICTTLCEWGLINVLICRADVLVVQPIHRIYLQVLKFRFTAPACKISGLKNAGTRQQTVYFSLL